jgi:uncharacterized sulfatase
MFPTAIGTMHMRSNAVPPPEVRCFTEYLRADGYYCTTDGFTDYQFQTPVSAFDDCSLGGHWRGRADRSQPFFAFFVGLMTDESQVDAAAHERVARPLPPELRHDPGAAPLPPYYPDTPAFREAFARYADNITSMDAWAGDLLRQLDEDGLRDDTMVVFWSDHGRGFPRAKRWPYDAGLRVPLLIRWPGKIARGTVRKELVYLMDLTATALVAAGVSVPVHMHSQMLFDANGDFGRARPIVFGHRDRMDETEDIMRTARDQRFRYIRNYHPDRPYAAHGDYYERTSAWRELRRLHWAESALRGQGVAPSLLTPAQRLFLATTKPEEELYDLDADPHEIKNLAGDRLYAADRDRLRTALENWRAIYGDLGMTPEAELIERWRPGGQMQVTAAPTVALQNGRITASCPTRGASIAWTSDPPTDVEPAGALTAKPVLPEALVEELKKVGAPDTGWRSWRLYSEPLERQSGPLWFRAHRLGFRASHDVVFER